MTAVLGAYKPPDHLGVVNFSKGVSDRVVAYWVEAVRRQLADVALAWGAPAPGVFLYDQRAEIVRSEGSIVVIVDRLPDLGAAGYHNALGGVVGLEESVQPDRVLSHEALELWGNWGMDRWFPGPGGLDYAAELVDAVEWDTYPEDVEMFGLSIPVSLSNYLLPSWFQAGAPPPYDRLGRCRAPFEVRPGAYQLAKNAEGEVIPLRFAATSTQPPPLLPTSRRRRIMERVGSAAPTTPQSPPPPVDAG